MAGLSVIISSHGFGHAARTAYVLRTVKSIRPDVELHIRSRVPSSFFDRILDPGSYTLHPLELDGGIIQLDARRMDLSATSLHLQEIRRSLDSLIEQEYRFVMENRVGAILSDVPSAASLIAERSGIPVFFAGNFGWDFIYEALGEPFKEHARFARENYGKATATFQYPFCEPMDSFAGRMPTGLPGQDTPRWDREELLSRYNPEQIPSVLLLFGGLGLSGIPYEKILRFDGKRGPRRLFYTFQEDAPDLPNLIPLDRGLCASDLLPICERIVTKPGFGTFADSYRAGTPMVVLERHGFAETPILIKALRDHFYSIEISEGDFFEGDWDFVLKDPEPPLRAEPVALDGNQTIARVLLEQLDA